MQKLTDADPETRSADPVAENVERLKDLFPEAFTEGKIDFEVLKQVLGGAVDERDEKYGLNWHGKRRARQIALTPSTGTLRPAPEESVAWDVTRNLMIEGDNLEVLKLLQKSYVGKMKMIFIDPPYNTGGDFIYADDFRDNVKNYLEMTDQAGDDGRFSSNTEQSGRFHTEWLMMLYPRLRLARNLLRADGVIFVTIDDNEVANLRMICDEIFGEENFVAQIEWQKRYTRSNNTDNFTSVIDHICMYRKSEEFAVTLLPRDEEANARFTNPDGDPRGPWKATPFLNQVAPEKRPNLCYPITNPFTGTVAEPDKKAWRYERTVYERLLSENRLYWGKDNQRLVPDIKTFLNEVRDGMTPINLWTHEYAGHTDQANREIKQLFGEKVFDTPKPASLVVRMLEHCDDREAIVLDFFAGSGTTAHAVFEKNQQDGGKRRFILVQLPEPTGRTDFRTISQITTERVRRAGANYQQSGIKIDSGFRVFKLDSSNIRAWDPDREDLPLTLESSVEHIKPDRTEQDVLYELLLKRGLDLAIPIEQREIAGKTVHSIGAGTMLVCLTERIGRDDVEPLTAGMIEWHAELAPAGETQVIFLDSAFADDVAKSNLAAILEQHGLKHVRSL